MSILAPMMQWWNARALRERLLLGLMSGLLAVWLVVVGVVQPLHAARSRLSDQILRHDHALSVLQSSPQVAAPVVATDERPLNILVTETTAQFQLTIRRLEPEGARIRVVLDEVPFDAVILWIEAIERDNGLRVTETTLTRRPAPGVVNATLVLER